MVDPIVDAPPAKPQNALDKLLRDELAAAATYEQALNHVEDPAAQPELEKNRESHVSRAVMLAQLVREAGGTPAETAGPWGTFTKLVERTAAVISPEAVLEVLREGEKHSTNLYVREMTSLDGAQLKKVQDHGLAEQKATEGRIDALVS